MEYFSWAFLLLALANVCAGDLELKILGSPERTEQPGRSMELSCHLNKGMLFTLTHTIEWVHVSLVDRNKPKETVLTKQQTLLGDASSYYNISVKFTETDGLFSLRVKKVRAQDDGRFICRVSKFGGGEKIEKKANVTVVNDVEKIALQFNDSGEIIKEEVQTKVRRDEGHYAVTCMASGFNPNATIKLFLGNQEQEIGSTQITQDAEASRKAGARRYSARATATNVHLKAEHSDRQLKCQAHASFTGAATLVASVPLSVIVLVPVIECDKNASAKLHEKYVKIKCYVKHENIEIVGYSWEIGATGEIIKPNGQNENYHEMIVQELGNDVTLVTLDLYEVGEEHFNTLVFLDVFTKSGQKFRTEAALIREPDTSASPKTSAAFVVCLLSTVLGLVSCL